MSLGDLDELVLSCRTEESREYMREAVSCYKTGAYRSCIVATWIAVVFDLIAKIRELALAGDAPAQTIVANLTAWQPFIEKGDMSTIKKSLEFERDIVTIAHDQFAFFDGLQLIDLDRLHADRNRCAHPTYQGSELPYSPSAELSRAHIVHAIRHVLAEPPVQGKAATEAIIRIVKSNYFPSEIAAAKIQLKSVGLERSKDNLVRSVTDALVFGFFEGSADLKGRMQAAVALAGMHELFPGVSEPRIIRNINLVCRRLSDADLPLVMVLNNFLKTTWNWLERDNQSKIGEMIKKSTDALASDLVRIGLKIVDLQAIATERLKRMDTDAVAPMFKKNPSPATIAHGVDLYCASKSWDQANARYEKVVEPAVDQLSDEQIERIIRAPGKEGADLNGSHSFSKFARHMHENNKLGAGKIVEILRDENMTYIADRFSQPLE